MKVLVVLAVLVACTQAGSLSSIAEKLIPGFPQGFVIKGEEAAPHSAPYIVSLSRSAEKHAHVCGGSLIAKDWIITAGHCVGNPIGMGIVAGLHERLNIDEKTQSRVVDWGMVHRDYSGGVAPNDIALLHVSEAFELNEYVQIVALPSREEIHSGTTHLYGWGQPKAYILTGSKTLQTVETQIVEYNTCKAILPDNSPLHETNICSDSMNQGISACNGDSGGPLVVEYENAPSELIGLASWVYLPCGYSQMPSIYTRVSAHIDWIAKVQNAYYVLH